MSQTEKMAEDIKTLASIIQDLCCMVPTEGMTDWFKERLTSLHGRARQVQFNDYK